MVGRVDFVHRGVGGAALVGAFLAFGIFVREYNSFYAGVGSRALDYAISDGAFAPRPAGLQSVQREVGRCFEALDSARVSVLRGDVKARAYANCLALADGVLLGASAHGGALQLRAEALLALVDLNLGAQAAGDSAPDVAPDFAAVIAAQDLAARAAPYSFWLMQRRLLVALSIEQAGAVKQAGVLEGSGVLGQMVDRDVPKMMTLDAGRTWLAQIYPRQPALRGVIARNEAQLTAADAASFVRKLKAQAADRASDTAADQGGGAAP